MTQFLSQLVEFFVEKANSNLEITESIARRTAALFEEHRHTILRRTDRLLAGLMVFQWPAAVAAAYWISPKTWAGPYSQTHFHVWAALFLGGVITVFPVFLALSRPGASSTRHVIATAQMLMSALLIHLTGGRIETHFHVFGSLAFLAFYRDWRVFVPATLVVAADHFVRGVYWPQSVFGVLTASPWRWLEHAGWVIFEDIFLIKSCFQSLREMWNIAAQRAQLEASNELVERKVHDRTAELQASEERFRSLSASSPVGIFQTDAAGRCIYTNERLQAITGLTLEESLGDGWRRAIEPEDREAVLVQRAAATREGREISLEYRMRTPRGELRWVHARATPVHSSNGEMTGYVGTVEDISERKRAEEELKAAKEAAEAANRAKSEFLANMSHEIRTPMNGILGMTELVLDTELTAEQREFLQMARASGESLLSVINDVLDFSKVEAGRLDFDAIEFNLRDSLGDTIKTLSLRAHEKRLELVFYIQTDVPDALVGDPGRLRQIVINLVGNAIRFTERGEVVARVEKETQTEDEVCLHFVVSDTGMGIPVEKQRAIFEAFTQADGSMTRKYAGTGLGLTISSRLVERMGGRIWVESEPGKGSAFHFTARLGLRKVAPRTTVTTEPLNLSGLPVLVVDDNATNRRILQEMLKNWQMRATAVEGGRAALGTLEEAKDAGKPFPLVLLDAQMPELDGFAVAARIKENPELAGATVMMLTSVGRRGDAARCQELGIAAYLTKPIKQSELLEAIRLALGVASGKETRPQLITRYSLREARQRFRILLAEDNPVNQTLAVRLLEKQGHAVVVAGDGQGVLAALGQQPFDLVLMDVQMPEMDGLETTAVIREEEKITGAHLPIIAMTAHAMKGDQERCLAAGMDGYLSKPIQSKELFEEIERVVLTARRAEQGVPVERNAS